MIRVANWQVEIRRNVNCDKRIYGVVRTIPCSIAVDTAVNGRRGVGRSERRTDVRRLHIPPVSGERRAFQALRAIHSIDELPVTVRRIDDIIEFEMTGIGDGLQVDDAICGDVVEIDVHRHMPFV